MKDKLNVLISLMVLLISYFDSHAQGKTNTVKTDSFHIHKLQPVYYNNTPTHNDQHPIYETEQKRRQMSNDFMGTGAPPVRRIVMPTQYVGDSLSKCKIRENGTTP